MNIHPSGCIGRVIRCLVVALGIVAAGAAIANPNERLEFGVYLEDERIGFHRVEFRQDGPERRVDVVAEMDVKILFFNAFSYRHSASERWLDGCIVALETRTNDDGDVYEVVGRSIPAGLQVSTLETQSELSGCIRTFAYWNPDLLDSAYLLNTQTGEYEPAQLQRLDDQPLVFRDETIGEQQFRLNVGDETEIRLWYSANGEWLALETTVTGGSTLRYIREMDS